MNWMFKGSTKFNGNLSAWDTSNVETMTGTFSGAKAFQGNGLKQWDISKVNSTSFMFQDAQSFNEDISTWNMTSVTNANYMLMFAQSFNQNLCKWGDTNADGENTFPYFAADSIFFQSGCTYTSTPQWDTQGPFCGDVCPILSASSATISLSSSIVLSSLMMILLGLFVL